MPGGFQTKHEKPETTTEIDFAQTQKPKSAKNNGR